MFEKNSKLPTKSIHKGDLFKNQSKSNQRTFVALKDSSTDRVLLHDLNDSYEYDLDNFQDFNNITSAFMRRSIDERTMTRKTRSRQPRIHKAALQSGYCAICHLDYNSLEDHIQSKKHLKLIGDDANFISLNGFIDQDASLSSLLNGIGIGINGKTIESDYLPRQKKNKMHRRTISVCERVRPAPLSPPRNEKGHHLRSRKQINYASPIIIEEDSLPEKELKSDEKDSREKRSSTRLLAKLVDQENTEVWNSGRPKRSCIRKKRLSLDHFELVEQDHENEEVWNSGRPKRACIREKRISIDDSSDLDQENEDMPSQVRYRRSSCFKSKRASADERLVSDNKTYYKVEVMSSKLRSSGTTNNKDHEVTNSRRSTHSPHNNGGKSDDKALIVKFRKLRNSELKQLNNEAENFLFPKKDDSSSEDDPDASCAEDTTLESGRHNDSTLLLSDIEEVKSPKFKHEDDASMDSNYSDSKRKKKRRSHAEAFIIDNQKYYKFETPGSRLRYQGSFLPQPELLHSPKHNGDHVIQDKCEKQEVELTDEKELSFNLDDYKFSFERVPKNEPWYQTFERQDLGQEKYIYYNDDDFWNPFLLPYQLGHLAPIDPRTCFTQYQQVKKILQEPASSSSSSGGTTTPDPTASASGSNYDPEEDEDSKLSASTTELSSEATTEDNEREDKVLKARLKRPKMYSGGGKNARKSPRQHASTLAILSSLIHQRKKRARSSDLTVPKVTLTPIPEEQLPPPQPAPAPTPQPPPPPPPQKRPTPVMLTPTKLKKSPGRPPRIDYKAILRNIEDELLNSFDPELDNLDFKLTDGVAIFNAKTTAMDVLRLYDDCKAKEDYRSTRRFFNGTPGRKPGRKKKKNRTGWPRNVSRRFMRKVKDEDLDDSTMDSLSVNADSEDNEFCEDTNSTDSINKKDIVNKLHSANGINKNDQNSLSDVDNCDLVERDNNRVMKRHGSESTQSENKINSDNVSKGCLLPVVRVQKLDSTLSREHKSVSPKRTNVRQRRMPASPKSPRMLRKPRGRWYRER